MARSSTSADSIGLSPTPSRGINRNPVGHHDFFHPAKAPSRVLAHRKTEAL